MDMYLCNVRGAPHTLRASIFERDAELHEAAAAGDGGELRDLQGVFINLVTVHLLCHEMLHVADFDGETAIHKAAAAGVYFFGMWK